MKLEEEGEEEMETAEEETEAERRRRRRRRRRRIQGSSQKGLAEMQRMKLVSGWDIRDNKNEHRKHLGHV